MHFARMNNHSFEQPVLLTGLLSHVTIADMETNLKLVNTIQINITITRTDNNSP